MEGDNVNDTVFKDPKKVRVGYFASLKRKLSLLNEAVLTGEYETVSMNLSSCQVAFQRFAKAHGDYLTHESDECEKARANEQYAAVRDHFYELSTKCEMMRREENESVRGSVVSHSNKSRVSTSSSCRIRMRLTEARLRKEAVERENSLEVLHENEVAELHRIIEQKERDHVRKIKLHEANLELSIAEDLALMNDKVSSTGSVHALINTEIQDVKTKAEFPVSHSCQGGEVVPSRVVPNVSHNNDSIAALADALRRGPSLPNVEMLKFSGDPGDYAEFRTNFRISVEIHVQDDSERFMRLLSQCDGRAREAIRSCVNLPVGTMYENAWKILKENFGQPHLVAECQIKRLKDCFIKRDDAQSMLFFCRRLEESRRVLDSLGDEYANRLDNDDLIRFLMRKLPDSLRNRWVERAGTILMSKPSVRFIDFIEFVKLYGTKLNNVFGMDQKVSNSGTKSRFTALKTATNMGSSSSTFESNSTEKTCLKCKETHPLWKCEEFKTLSESERYQFVRDERLCLKCLRSGHQVKNCRANLRCTICKSFRHNSLLHRQIESRVQVPEMSNPISDVRISRVASTKVTTSVWMKVVPVKVAYENRSVITYAFLDSGSDATICTDELLDSLGARCQTLKYKLITMTGEDEVTGRRATLNVSSIDGRQKFDLNFITADKIPISSDSFASEIDIEQYPHLKGIELPQYSNAKVSILIGSDNAHIVESQIDKRIGKSNEPIAILTCFGWAVCGNNKNCAMNNVLVNRIKKSVDLNTLFQHMYDSDFKDLISDDQKSASPAEEKAMAIMEASSELKDGHYHVRLPFNSDSSKLKGNFSMAFSRLQHLKVKLERNPSLKDSYRKVLQRYEDEGAAKRIGKVASDDRWFLPHHAVINVKKPEPRIVFDCAARFGDLSLNDKLFKGPENTNPMIEVLLRFRLDVVAVVADIRSMFHQVRVHDDDSKRLSFLWWATDNFQEEPETYEMKVHLFGATSSPSVCGYALRRTAEDHKMNYSDNAVESVKRDFYVDDYLRSFDDSNKAVSIAKEVRDLLAHGGFTLTKWLSNDPEFTQAFPSEECSTTSRKFEFREAKQKALGVVWEVDSDKFAVCISDLTKFQRNRRGVLSSVASVFDPLGIVAPIILRGKRINQELCERKVGWDEGLPNEVSEAWNAWLDQLTLVRELDIPRCYRPRTFQDILRVELHHFSDASQSGYGTVSYLRFISNTGEVHCAFVYAKSRVKPSKKGITIPRLELTAAALLVPVHNLIMRSLSERLEVDSVTFWTDSMIVIKYIRNEDKRLTVFVENRVAKIREISSASQWKHVRSEENPADLASRGLNASDVTGWNFWSRGPKFLWENDELHNSLEFDVELSDFDEGVIQKKITLLSLQDSGFWSSLFNRYSTWSRLLRIVATMLRAVQKLKGRATPGNHPSIDDLRRSERIILSEVQKDVYGQELSRNTSLQKLRPIVKDGLIRVGGRLEHSNLPETTRHPIILPPIHPVTVLVIRYFHEINCHVGVNHTLSLLRTKYWIIRGLSAVQRVVSRCHVCKRQNQRPSEQLMAPLPAERVSQNSLTYPFEVTGVDLFGPLYVRKGVRTRSQGIQSSLKRYGVIFTCLKVRAVHLEVATDLSTDSFINCLLRFIARRGAPRILISDNGTNFRGASLDVIEGLKRLNHERIQRVMSSREVCWKFNPPAASHRGGIWERLIRSVRKLLNSQAQTRVLNEDTLHTYLCEVEKVLNDRPLTRVSEDPNDLECLTPNHILLLNRNSSSSFVSDVNDLRVRWKFVSALADEFWLRWRRDYLVTLQERQKWINPRRNFQVGDLVLIVEPNEPRGCWKKGLVVDVRPGDDGFVREVVLKCAGGVLKRDVRKICLLEECLVADD